ncbi:MAG: hypothetical protein ACI92G_004651, partial [Candidatus Pelagisphaera sp.]
KAGSKTLWADSASKPKTPKYPQNSNTPFDSKRLGPISLPSKDDGRTEKYEQNDPMLIFATKRHEEAQR